MESELEDLLVQCQHSRADAGKKRLIETGMRYLGATGREQDQALQLMSRVPGLPKKRQISSAAQAAFVDGSLACRPSDTEAGLLDLASLEQRIALVAGEQRVDKVDRRVRDLICLAVQEQLRVFIEQLIAISQRRTEVWSKHLPREPPLFEHSHTEWTRLLALPDLLCLMESDSRKRHSSLLYKSQLKLHSSEAEPS
jgi:hypothetical protein